MVEARMFWTLVIMALEASSRDIAIYFNNSPVWEGERCHLPSNSPGVCSRLQHCRRVEVGRWPQICSYANHGPIVCCLLSDYVPNNPAPTKNVSQSTLSKSREACEDYYRVLENNRKGQFTMIPIVIGGENTDKKEFPHMAAIGYGGKDDISWLCGGSLISLRFVLTAGHCLRSSQKGPASWVRLGDRNLEDSTDDVSAQQFSVLERIPHPDYRPPAHYNDIALIRLDREAIWSLEVRPACLHIDEPIHIPVATGWGLTDWAATKGSAHLMKVQLDVQVPEECQKGYQSLAGTKRLPNGFDNASMLCVGNLKGGKDTCQGDSGGPYQMDLHRAIMNFYSVIGVTSFGSPICGAKNVPAVYSRVAHFVPWVESVVWP